MIQPERREEPKMTQVHTSFTPGPWVAEEVTYNILILAAGAVLTSAGGGFTKEELEANARLIAAAPEMYEALNAVRHFLAKDDGRDEVALGLTVMSALHNAEGK